MLASLRESASDSAGSSELDILGAGTPEPGTGPDDRVETETDQVVDSENAGLAAYKPELKMHDDTDHNDILISDDKHQMPDSLSAPPAQHPPVADQEQKLPHTAASELDADGKQAAGAGQAGFVDSHADPDGMDQTGLIQNITEDGQGHQRSSMAVSSAAAAAAASAAAAPMPTSPPTADDAEYMLANGHASDDDELPLAVGAQQDFSSRSGSRSGSLDSTPSSTPTPEPDDMGNRALGSRPAGSSHARASSRGRRTRRNIMPRITKEQRCGRCRTCLRPQLKKACETVRAQLMSKMGEEGDLPLSLLGRLQEGPSSRSISELPRPQRPAVRASYATLEQETPNQQPPAKRQKPASEELPHEPLDPFSEALTDILSGSDGKVGERDAARLQKLFKDEITLEKRHVLLDVLQEHCLPPTKKLFVHGSGLKTLETWLSEAISHDKLQLAEKVLQVLKVMPVDIPALQACTLGKTLMKTRKTAPESLQSDMTMLIARWKKMLSEPAPAPAAVGDKRPREGAAAANGVTKPPKTGTEPAAKRPAVAQKASTDKPSTTAPKPAQPAQPATAKAAVAAPLRSVLDISSSKAPAAASGVTMTAIDDEAVFKKPAAQPKPVARAPAVPSVHKVHTLKILDADAAKELGKQRIRPDTGSPAAHAKPANGFEQPTGPGSVKQQTPHNTAPHTIIGSTTRIGGPGSLPLAGYAAADVVRQPWEMTASERARLAADRVPSPPRDAPKPRRKSVRWVLDEELVRSRWFLKEDAPSRVRKDDDPLTPEAGAAHVATADEPPSGRFQRAAQREHISEAAAMLHKQYEEDEEDTLAGMAASMDWSAQGPTFVQLLPSDAEPIGLGEDSSERPTRIGYISHAPEAVDSYRHPLGDAKEPPLSWTLAGDPSVIFPWSAHETQQPAAGPLSAPVAPQMHQPRTFLQTIDPSLSSAFSLQTLSGIVGALSAAADLPQQAQHGGQHQAVTQQPQQPQQPQQQSAWQLAAGNGSEEPADGQAAYIAPGPGRGGRRGHGRVLRGRHDDARGRGRGGRDEAHLDQGQGPHNRGRGGRAGRTDRGRGAHAHAGQRDSGRTGGGRGRGRDGMAEEQSRPLRKTCIFFNTEKGCRKGDQCPFAHMATDQSREEIQAEIERITHKGRPGHPHAEAEHQSHAHAHVHAQGDHSQHPYHHLGFGKQQKHGTAKGGLPFRQKGAQSEQHIRKRERDDAWG